MRGSDIYRMRELINKIGARKVIIGIIIFQVGFMILLGAVYKRGMFLDEYYSFGLANSYYNPFFYLSNNWLSNWHSADFFKDYLNVTPDNRFAYGSVIFNQSQDVHPPIYYLILHTLCSIFTGSHSKWIGISINIVFFIIAQMILYKIMKKLTNYVVATVACAIFGFSLGAANMVLFIRMYMLFTTEVLLYLYLHMKLLERIDGSTNEKNDVKNQIYIYGSLFLTIYIGALTHYYFIVYAFFISAVFFLIVILKKLYKKALIYAGSIFAGLILAALSFPHMKSHILSGDRGTQAIGNAFNVRNWFIRIVEYSKVVIRQQLGHFAFYFIAVFIVYLLIRYFNNKKNNGENSTKPLFRTDVAKYMMIIMFVASVCFCGVASIVSPFVEGRYVYASYPVLAMIAITFIYRIMDFSKSTKIVAFSLLILYFIGNWTFNEGIQFAYPWYDIVNKIISEKENDRLIYITDGSYEAVAEVGDFANYKEVYPVKIEDIDQVPDVLTEKYGEIPDFIYVYCDIDNESWETKEIFMENTGYTNWEWLYFHDGYNYTYGSLYRFYK